MAHCVEILLAIPPSNAEVERIKSSMKNTLHEGNTRSEHDTLEDRLRIKYLKQELQQFDLNKVIQLLWSKSMRSRRPFMKD